jgi:hypothetical protein
MDGCVCERGERGGRGREGAAGEKGRVERESAEEEWLKLDLFHFLIFC